ILVILYFRLIYCYNILTLLSLICSLFLSFFYFFTFLFSLSLHDALPISSAISMLMNIPSSSTASLRGSITFLIQHPPKVGSGMRSEEHTSELQSRFDLVCRLLLVKKKKFIY